VTHPGFHQCKVFTGELSLREKGEQTAETEKAGTTR